MVRAKFVVDVVENNRFGQRVKLIPVIGGSEENKEFYKMTPGGSIDLSHVNDAIKAVFVPEKEFYIDFTEVS